MLMVLWEFFKYMILPFIILGVILSTVLGLLWFIGQRIPKFKKLENITPDKFYQATIVVIIVAALIYMVFSGERTGIENDGF